jgi:hypothetical protein
VAKKIVLTAGVIPNPKNTGRGAIPTFFGYHHIQLCGVSPSTVWGVRKVKAKLIPPFGMQLRKVIPDAASDVVTHESASQQHVVYQILRHVFDSRLIGPIEKHNSSASKNRYSTFNTVGISCINRGCDSHKKFTVFFLMSTVACLTRGESAQSLNSSSSVLTMAEPPSDQSRQPPNHFLRQLHWTSPSLGLVLTPAGLANATEVPNSYLRFLHLRHRRHEYHASSPHLGRSRNGRNASRWFRQCGWSIIKPK